MEVISSTSPEPTCQPPPAPPTHVFFFLSLHSPKLKFRLIFHAALNLPGSCGFAGGAVPGRQTSGTLVHAALHHTPRSLQLQLPAFFRGSCADGRRTAKLISDVGEPIRLLPFQALPHRALKNPKHWGRCATYQLRKLLTSERKIQQGWKSVHSEALRHPNIRVAERRLERCMLPTVKATLDLSIFYMIQQVFLLKLCVFPPQVRRGFGLPQHN